MLNKMMLGQSTHALAKERAAELSNDDSSLSEMEPTIWHLNNPTPSADPPTSFADLGVMDALCKACDSLGYKSPTPIQSQCIPPALRGRDIIGIAEPGSGKTTAFVLPILQALMNNPQPLHTLILAPSKKLAERTANLVETLGVPISISCAPLIEGNDMVSQAISLEKMPYIIVATPERLLDHLENTNGFSLEQLKYLVLDDAQKLLSLDFDLILDKLLMMLPSRRTYLFLVAMFDKVESLQHTLLTDPIRISVSSQPQISPTLLQSYTIVRREYKDVHLLRMLNERIGQRTIIFTRTAHDTERVSNVLQILGFAAIHIHGKLAYSDKSASLNKFREQSRNILIATDAGARGLDIPPVDLIVNYDLPRDTRIYIHRVGMTARDGTNGVAISFVSQYDLELLWRIESMLGKKLDEYKITKAEVTPSAEPVNEAPREAAAYLEETRTDTEIPEGSMVLPVI